MSRRDTVARRVAIASEWLTRRWEQERRAGMPADKQLAVALAGPVYRQEDIAPLLQARLSTGQLKLLAACIGSQKGGRPLKPLSAAERALWCKVKDRVLAGMSVPDACSDLFKGRRREFGSAKTLKQRYEAVNRRLQRARAADKT